MTICLQRAYRKEESAKKRRRGSEKKQRLRQIRSHSLEEDIRNINRKIYTAAVLLEGKSLQSLRYQHAAFRFATIN